MNSIARLMLASSAIVLTGCAYALTPPVVQPPFQLRLVSPHPAIYTIRVAGIAPKAYAIPSDGRVSLDVPVLFHGCYVSLLGVIPIRGPIDESGKKMVEVQRANGTSRKLSFRQLFELPRDGQGYHLLNARD